MASEFPESLPAAFKMRTGGQTGLYPDRISNEYGAYEIGSGADMQSNGPAVQHNMSGAYADTTVPTATMNGMHGYADGIDAQIMPMSSSLHSMTKFHPLNDSLGGAQGRHSLSPHGEFPARVVENGSATTRGRTNSYGDSDTMSVDGRSARDQTVKEQDGNNTSPLSKDEAGKSDEGQSGMPPSWSEMKTKAGKERKRLPLACIACRRKKIRCSGESPACKHCLRARIPCVYKITTRKAAPRTDYMAMLDKRLKRMEDRVIRTIPKDEQQDAIAATNRAVVKPPLPSGSTKPASASKKRAAEQAFGDELEEWANGEAKHGSTSKEATSRENKTTDEQSLLLEGADRLPDKDLQEHLAEVFFDFVYGQSYHLLHKPSFMRKLAQGNVPPVLMLAVCAISARFSNHPSVRTEPAFLRGEEWARAARDISFRRYDKPNITILIVYLILGLHEFGTCHGGRSWMFGGMAQRMAYALQLHRDLSHDPGERTAKVKTELSSTDREIRRRTMWSCFLMDRFNSSGTDRPIFVGQQHIRAQLPVKESYYLMELTGPTEDLDGRVPHVVEPSSGEMSNAQNNMGVAAYLIRLVAIWGSLISYINLGGRELDPHAMWTEKSKFQEIKQAISEWKGTLPESLLYNETNLQTHASEKIANQFLFLHIIYYQILLFMNQFALPPANATLTWPEEMPKLFRNEASQIALEAASQISHLAHESMNHDVVAPFAGYAAFFSSTVHIPLAFSKNAQQAALSKQCLSWNVKFLTKMKRYWGTFFYMSESLRDQYRQHADAAKAQSSGRTANGGGKTSAQAGEGGASCGPGSEDAAGLRRGELERGKIFQYGDWFDRYPHGVSGTDFEEPATQGVGKEPGADAVLGQKSDLQTVEEFFAKLSPPSRATKLPSQQSQRPSQPQQKVTNETPGTKKQRASTKTEDVSHKGLQRTQRDSKTMENLHFDGEKMRAGQVHEDSSAVPQGYDDSAQSGSHPQSSTPFVQSGFQPPQTQHDQMLINPRQIPQLFSHHHPNLASISMQQPQQAQQPLQPMQSGGMFDPYHMSSIYPSNAAVAGNSFWGNPSTAWFEPYNMDPPVDDGSAMFGGAVDWANGLGGAGPFGDFSNVSGMDVDGSGFVGDLANQDPGGTTDGSMAQGNGTGGMELL